MRKRIVIIVGVLALAALGWGGYRRVYGRGSGAEEEVQTFTVERGRIVSTVNAVGGVEAHRQLDLTFQASGRLVKLLAKEGKHVEAGRVLAQLDTAQLEIAVGKARAILANAEASLAKVRVGPTEAELASARASLASAEENLARVQAGPTEEQIAAAEASLKAAQESYRQLLASPTEEDVALAKAQVEQARLNWEKAKSSLWASQIDRDAIKGRPSSPQYQIDSANAKVSAAELAVQVAEVDYGRAQITYVLQTQSPTAEQLAIALSQIEKASDALNQLRAQPTDSELAAGEAQRAQARAQLDKLEASPTEEELAMAEAQVEQTRLGLQEAELRLRDAQIVAPFSGWVVSIQAEEGQMITGNKVILSLADLSSLQIEVAMDEIDVSKVKEGQRVLVTLDALPGSRPSMGRVERVALAGTVSQGIVSYPVTVSLDGPDPAIKPGMTANAQIVVEQKDDVLVVPNRAVRRQGQQRVVEVIRNGSQVEVPVTIGLVSESTSEVLEGLVEGEQVVIPGTTSVQSSTGGMRGIFGGRPPGR